MNQNIYTVQWKSKITGQTGKSETPMSYSSARSWINSFKTKYPEIEHFVKLK
jgi:hypothetical protein